MLSRVAHSLYWMSRYSERVENIARFIDVNMNLILDVPVNFEYQWAPLVKATGDHEDFEDRYPQANQRNVIQFLTFDRENPNSIYSAITAARENARSIREIISLEMWEQINHIYLMIKEAACTNTSLTDPATLFTDIKKACHLFIGTTDTTMTHGEGWHFVRLGRLLERADKSSRILDVKYFILLPELDYVGTPFDSLQWTALLKSMSASEMYRKSHHRICPKQIAQFLILDGNFPRAIHYCLIKAGDSLRAISESYTDSYSNQAEQRLGRLRSELDYAGINEIFHQGLHEYLDTFQWNLNEVGTAIHDTYFESPAVVAGTPSRYGI